MAREQILKNWYELVALYSKRQISFKSDRLPAISALARAYSRKLEDDYLGGHWKSTLPIEMISHARGGGKFGGSGSPLNATWSWISYDGRISWAEGEFVQDDHFEILGCHIDYTTTDDIFGAIDGAELRVRGLLYHAPPETMHRDRGRPHRELIRNVEDCSPSELQSLSQILILRDSEVRYDYKEEAFSQDHAYPEFYESLYLLLVAYEIEPSRRVDSTSPQRPLYGLVLYHHNDDKFSRVGWFLLYDWILRDKEGKGLQPVIPSTDRECNEVVLDLWHEQIQEITMM